MRYHVNHVTKWEKRAQRESTQNNIHLRFFVGGVVFAWSTRPGYSVRPNGYKDTSTNIRTYILTYIFMNDLGEKFSIFYCHVLVIKNARVSRTSAAARSRQHCEGVKRRHKSFDMDC
ncbi:unnamed protein product [Ceratitis capitata]|uniref:(Mediterranean fruit fly) hypothetical protein n=1 Tax=Ceratitis capitata TaxID=7213 RepID=A0A811U1W0_CERCA|nr:unnamed protein product [Ceratitis capitata]